MKLNPFRWRTVQTPAPTPETAKESFESLAPQRSAPAPPRMYSLMLPSFTDRK
jgi:hypothetical protein